MALINKNCYSLNSSLRASERGVAIHSFSLFNCRINKVIVLLICFIFVSELSFAESVNIGKIDLSLALFLHPQMSLFDFERLGFYKVPVGLSDEEFEEKVTRLKNKIPENDSEILSLKNKIKELKNDLNLLYYSKKEINEDEKQNKIEKLILQIEAMDFDINNPDITNIIETKKIFININKEISEAIEEVAKEQNLQLVLNDWAPYRNVFPKDYINRFAFKPNIEIPFENFYQTFLDDVVESTKKGNFPTSNYLSGWLEHQIFPGQIAVLPLNSQSLVIAGAKDILVDVLKKIYKKNNMSLDILTKLERLLHNNENVKSNLFIKDGSLNEK